MFQNNISTELIYLFVILIIVCMIYSIYSDLNISSKKTKIEKNIVEIIPELNFENDALKSQYNQYLQYFGEPNYLERNNLNNITSVTYMQNLMLKSELGKFKGLDYIKLNSHINYTQHPKVIFNNITVGKYIRIPERLYGSILYSSPTFSIEQLNVPREFNEYYKNYGKHKFVLLKCESNSLQQGVFSIDFILKMIMKYKSEKISEKMNILFRDQYDKKMLSFYETNNHKFDWFKL